MSGNGLEKKSADNTFYAAFKAKDTRFDGRFFVGVSTTGIYCRPVCRARQPKMENCTFYPSAAEAEQAGYRPCLLCRPELAPGTSTTDSASTLARHAARIIEENCGNGLQINEFAEQLGYTDRHFRRLFTTEFNVSPVQYLQTCRLLLAKNLLTDTNLPVFDAAIASGFGSLRRFNDLFKKHYNLSPSGLRKKLPEEQKESGNITLTLTYRPSYRFEEILDFLESRAIAGVELVKDGNYFRTVDLVDGNHKQVYGWLKAGHKPEKNALMVTMSESLLPVLPQVLAKLRRLFDLYCDPHAIYEKLSQMNTIRRGLCVPGTRLPGCFNTFEMAARAVLGQQITVKAASTLASRLVTAFGKEIKTGIPGLTHVFPGPKDILALGKNPENFLGPLGIIAARAKTIYKLAEGFEQGTINLNLCTRHEEEMNKLLAIPGIGSWTAQYIAMRTMGWPDAFLETDVGIKKALPLYTSKELLKIAEAWKPWRSYAVINLWNSLQSKEIKER